MVGLSFSTASFSYSSMPISYGSSIFPFIWPPLASWIILWVSISAFLGLTILIFANLEFASLVKILLRACSFMSSICLRLGSLKVLFLGGLLLGLLLVGLHFLHLFRIHFWFFLLVIFKFLNFLAQIFFEFLANCLKVSEFKIREFHALEFELRNLNFKRFNFRILDFKISEF